jgi:hypothetical protein
MRLKGCHTLTCAFMLTLLSSTVSFADVLSGSFSIGGSSADVGLSSIGFVCNTSLPNAPAPCPATTGNFQVNVVDGSAALNAYLNQGGYVGDLSQATTPLNTTFLDADWLTFSSSAGNPVIPPALSLNLTFLPLGVDPHNAANTCLTAPAFAGQTCTPEIAALVSANNPDGLSNFNLQNTATGFTASFDVLGTAKDSATGNSIGFSGIFNATVSGETYQEALMQVAMGVAPPFTYSASFTLVPEPAFLPLFGGVAILLALTGLYRKVRYQRP